MRQTFVCLMVTLAFAPIGVPPLRAQSRWVVVSSSEPDSRISAQIRRLALKHHAQATFLKEKTAETPPREHPGTLTLELTQSESVDAFVRNLRQTANISTVELTPELAREGYILQAGSTGPSRPRLIKIMAASPEGFHNALLRLAEVLRPLTAPRPLEFAPPQFSALTQSGRNAFLILADFPSFPERGIVEGFYGKPWSHQERLDMLRFEGDHRMNVYYYAPKDDPYHRKLWREPYPPARMKQLGELTKTARANFVDFCFAISPGLSMVWSSDADFERLADKLRSVSKLGVSCFALFLDDVPQELENPDDRAHYKTLAAAHADVINRLHKSLKSQSSQYRLAVTPATYTNAWGSRDYIRDLGAAVNPDIPIVWTGPNVVSPEVTVAQAREWGALLRRKPLVWDNFPVNDGIPWRLNLGPLGGRDAGLPTVVRGFFSNPMNQAQASKIPLQTIAEYLWNPAPYDPQAALRRALVEQYGRLSPRQLEPFLSAYGDYWWDENIFQPLFTEHRNIFDTRKMKGRIALLTRTVHALRQYSRYRKLVRELAPFPLQTRERLAKVMNDPAFEHLANGQLRWREDYDTFEALRLAAPPRLDGDFSKWASSRVYTLDDRDQIVAGRDRWTGPGQFSARYALGWDDNYLYIGVEVTNPDLYQPFLGRDIGQGDVLSLSLETAFRKNFLRTHADGDEYQLLFSPGNFSDVSPSVYSEEDYLPPRPVSRDYAREIRSAWKKTANGFSGDIAFPVSWFEGERFYEGYEAGLVVSAQKAFAPPHGSRADEDSLLDRVLFRSKKDPIFPARFGNPATYQRLVFKGIAEGNAPGNH